MSAELAKTVFSAFMQGRVIKTKLNEVSIALEIGIYLYLAWRQNKEEGDVAWPSNRVIAERFGVTTVQVQRVKASLVRRGILENRGPRWTGGPQQYRILPPHHVHVVGSDSDAPSETDHPATSMLQGHHVDDAAPPRAGGPPHHVHVVEGTKAERSTGKRKRIHRKARTKRAQKTAAAPRRARGASTRDIPNPLLDVPRKLHREFAKLVMNWAERPTEAEAEAFLLEWYDRTAERWRDLQFGEDPFVFWRDQFRTAFGSSKEHYLKTYWRRTPAQSDPYAQFPTAWMCGTCGKVHEGHDGEAKRCTRMAANGAAS